MAKTKGSSSGKPAGSKAEKTTDRKKAGNPAPKKNIRNDKSVTNSGGPRKQ